MVVILLPFSLIGAFPFSFYSSSVMFLKH